ncbi:uncharacterized protein LOC119729751 [Patiria miniata]|uniref:Uncharacterized protein n=1 Tax=Patiria miniata TaxID=46514 RepID=A0A914A4T6_PATMI|nr:uncharacterized protein LOC119729751 [Patiria miniata]
MHFRQSLAESVWLVIGTLSLSLLNGPGVEANVCPKYYPFSGCPRPGDLLQDTVCCQRNSRYTCCTPEYIQGWGIGLIVVGSILICSLILITCCLCCRKKRKRQEYAILRDDFPPQQAGVIVVPSGPPPAPGQYGYNYNTMAYPPSNVSLPPAYEPTAKPAEPAAQPTQEPQGNNERMSENEEDDAV